jgi:Ni/Co efflux regulator RcnB
MKLGTLFTAVLLSAGLATAAQALERQTYGQDVDSWQAERDRAFRERGPAGLVNFDRETARRFYGDKFPNTRDLDVQIRIDRAETQLDTQERADQIRYGFGRAAAQAGVAPVVTPAFELRLGDSLPAAYRSNQFVVDDWRGHRLPSPRRGQHWVQVGADYALVNGWGVVQAVERPR